jgi:hypothetical protein
MSSSSSRPPSLFIEGVKGKQSGMNGGYYVTGEKSEGYDVYGKVGDDSLCIEHFRGRWQVKLVSDKGTNAADASVPGGCALEACTSRVWNVGDGTAFLPQPSVKMLFGADAEREVSCRCRLCARCNAPCITARFCHAVTGGACAGCS